VTQPQPKMHSQPCESAAEQRCTCPCKGSGHRRWLVERAILHDPAKPDPTHPIDLDRIFGSAFSDLTLAPGAGQAIASGRPVWKPITTASQWKTGGTASQIEQRIVDTALHDLLLWIASLPLPDKAGWSLSADALLGDHWLPVAAAINASSVVTHPKSGYFWAAVMSSAGSVLQTRAGAALWSTSAWAALQVAIEADLAGLRTAMIVLPRWRRAVALTELQNQSIRKAAAEAAVAGLRDAAREGLSLADTQMLVGVVGSATCLDLWHHPAAVRHCLFPAIAEFVARGHNTSLSVPKKTPDLITDHLETPWHKRGNW